MEILGISTVLRRIFPMILARLCAFPSLTFPHLATYPESHTIIIHLGIHVRLCLLLLLCYSEVRNWLHLHNQTEIIGTKDLIHGGLNFAVYG